MKWKRREFQGKKRGIQGKTRYRDVNKRLMIWILKVKTRKMQAGERLS